MATKAFLGEYNGKPTISIWEIDSNGEKTGKAPVVSFGKTKAKAILEHKEEIENFVNGKKVEEDL